MTGSYNVQLFKMGVHNCYINKIQALEIYKSLWRFFIFNKISLVGNSHQITFVLIKNSKNMFDEKQLFKNSLLGYIKGKNFHSVEND